MTTHCQFQPALFNFIILKVVWTFLPPALAEEVIFSVLFVCLAVCLSVCLSVCTLAGEPLDLWTWKLAYTFTSIISRTSSKVKVKGQRSRSHRSKMFNFSFSAYYQKRGQRSRSRGQGQGQRSRGQGQKAKFLSRAWLLLVTGEREVRQCWGVFIKVAFAILWFFASLIHRVMDEKRKILDTLDKNDPRDFLEAYMTGRRDDYPMREDVLVSEFILSNQRRHLFQW